jgi:PhnB protein
MLPENAQTVTPYLIVKDATKFIEFTKSLFNAEQIYLVMRDENLIAHAEIRIGNTNIMCADATDEFTPQPAGLFIYVESADASYPKALELGCIPVMDLSDQQYGRTCGVQDPFGNTWWITSEIRKKN